jgi:hypothetical protein
MQMKICTLILFLCCSACTNTKDENSDKPNIVAKTEIAFDKMKWRAKEEGDYLYREQMLADLMNNQPVRQLKGDQLFDLLGDPDRIDSLHLFYRIAQKRIGFFPLHTKTLVIQLSQDSTVNWIKIHE